MTALSDCPYRPGTPEWIAWQRQWIAEESRQRTLTGDVGATRLEKTAAGLADADTRIRQEHYGRPLSEYPEPWRSEIRTRMRARALSGPLQCRWCAKPYKTDRGAQRHMQGCWLNPDSDLYSGGQWAPIVDVRGTITGRVPTEAGVKVWASRRARNAAGREDLAERLGRDAIEAVAKALTSQRGTREHRALRLLARLEQAGWQLTRSQP